MQSNSYIIQKWNSNNNEYILSLRNQLCRKNMKITFLSPIMLSQKCILNNRRIRLKYSLIGKFARCWTILLWLRIWWKCILIPLIIRIHFCEYFLMLFIRQIYITYLKLIFSLSVTFTQFLHYSLLFIFTLWLNSKPGSSISRN